MSRRRTTNIINHPSLFDLPESRPTPVDDLPVHPAIKDFAVKIAAQGGQPAPEKPTSAPEIDEITTAAAPRRPLMFISFGSGSSGNCSYVGNGSRGFLIDAGVDPTHVEKALLRNGIDIDTVEAICLTHDHSDHIGYAYTLLRKHRHMRLYCTPKTINGLLRRHNISKRIKDYHSPIYKEFPFKIGPFEVTAFEVSHDGTDNSGYFIAYTRPDGAVQSMAVATDLGIVTDRVDHYMRLANHIVIESNYDSAMLANGPYPERLKARIRGERGHMDNDATAAFLAGIWTPALRHVFLCHLSHDNNTPAKATACIREALLGVEGVTAVGDGSSSLEAEKAPVQLAALPRFDASPLYVLTLADDALKP